MRAQAPNPVKTPTLKKAPYKALRQETFLVTKPCTPRTKAKAKAKKGKERASGQAGMPESPWLMPSSYRP